MPLLLLLGSINKRILLKTNLLVVLLIGAAFLFLTSTTQGQIPESRLSPSYKLKKRTYPRAWMKLDADNFAVFASTSNDGAGRFETYLQVYARSGYRLERQMKLQFSGGKVQVLDLVQVDESIFALGTSTTNGVQNFFLGKVNIRTGVIAIVHTFSKTNPTPSKELEQGRLLVVEDELVFYRLSKEENQQFRAEVQWITTGGEVQKQYQHVFAANVKMLVDGNQWIRQTSKPCGAQLEVLANKSGQVFSLIQLDGSFNKKRVPDSRQLILLVMDPKKGVSTLNVTPKNGTTVSAKLAIDPEGNPWVAGFYGKTKEVGEIVEGYFWGHYDPDSVVTLNENIREIASELQRSKVNSLDLHNNYRIAEIRFSQKRAFLVGEVCQEGGLENVLLPANVYWRRSNPILSQLMVVGPMLVVGLNLETGSWRWSEKWDKWQTVPLASLYQGGHVAISTGWGMLLLANVAISNKKDVYTFEPEKIMGEAANAGSYAIEVTDDGFDRSELMFTNSQNFYMFNSQPVQLHFDEILLYGEEKYNTVRWLELSL